MRGVGFGLIVILGLGLTILSLRPGGFRRQIRLVARRFRVVLVLGGIWMFGSLVLRLAFTAGPAVDYGPAGLAILLLIVFAFVVRDPDPSTGVLEVPPKR